MSKTEIDIFAISKTQVNKKEVDRWLKFLGADEFVIPEDEVITNPALLVALAGKRCYKAFQVSLNPNLTRVRNDYDEYFDNILKSGHGSVLEHAVFSFAIENVSRVFTGEMNRHRAGWAISEGSMRFIRYSENIPYWEPPSICGPDVLKEEVKGLFQVSNPDSLAVDLTEPNGPRRGWVRSLDEKKQATRLVFQRAFGNQADWYRVLEAIWAEELHPDSKFKGKKEITSLLRRIVGMGVATGGVWTGNVRALRHVITMRCEPAAEEEILYVFSRIAKMMHDEEPHLFGDFYQDDAGFWRPKYRKV